MTDELDTDGDKFIESVREAELSELYELYIYRDHTCAIVRIALDRKPFNHYAGYIRLTEREIRNVRLESDTTAYGDFIPADINVHGGVSFGPSDEGWIGFDCSHAGDCCYRDDGTPLQGSINLREAEKRRKSGASNSDKITNDWYPSDVKGEIMDIVNQLHELTEYICPTCNQNMMYDNEIREYFCPACSD